jgi:hypothetical protein
VRAALLQTPVAFYDRPRGVRVSGELLRVMKGYGAAVYLDKVGVGVGCIRTHGFVSASIWFARGTRVRLLSLAVDWCSFRWGGNRPAVLSTRWLFQAGPCDPAGA